MNGEPAAGGGLRRARICAAASGLLLVSVLITGGLRSAEEDRKPPADTLPAARESISAFAADRDTLRREELEQLEEIAEEDDVPPEIRSAALERSMSLRKWMEMEATISDVLKARGYDAPVVTVHDDSVNVVVRAEALTQEEAAVILELAMRETGVDGGNVKIIPIN